MVSLSPPPIIYAVVVNWNRPADTLACLQSLTASQEIRPRLLVVDNASTDDSVSQIREAYPEAECICSPENLGYGRGANLGVRQALEQGADYVLLINNDAFADVGALTSLLAYTAADVGILAPLIYYADPPDQIWSIGGRSNPLTLEQSNPGKDLRDPGDWPEVIEQDFVPGCCMLVPRHAFEQVGFFDELFEMYYDDADFCARIRRAGLRILVIPAAKMWHKVAASSGGSDSPNERYWMARSSVLFFRKHVSGWRWLVVFPYRLGSALRTSLRLTTKRRFTALSAYWHGLLDGLRQTETW